MSISLKPDSKLIVRLDFEGCITSENIDAVPQQGGVYAAFVCNKLVDRDGFYRCSRIAYIGKAEGTDNLRKRIRQHLSMRTKSLGRKPVNWLPMRRSSTFTRCLKTPGWLMWSRP